MENGAWWTQVNTCCRIKWQLSTGDWELSPHVIPCETWHSTLSTVFYVLRLLHNPCKRLNLTHFQSLSRHTTRSSVCGQHHQYVWQAGNLESLAFTLVHNSLSVCFALLKGKQLFRSISESLKSRPCAIFIDFHWCQYILLVGFRQNQQPGYFPLRGCGKCASFGLGKRRECVWVKTCESKFRFMDFLAVLRWRYRFVCLFDKFVHYCVCLILCVCFLFHRLSFPQPYPSVVVLF